MPLTIDALTLSWFSTRVALWLSRRGLVAALLLGSSAGCVPAMRLEEAQSAAQVEMEGRRRAEHQLQQLSAEKAALEAELATRQAALDEQEHALAQANLDTNVQGKQRLDAEGLVEQLRSELARAGEHLRSYHDDRQKLSGLREKEAERGRGLARVARDLSLSLSEPLAAGRYTLDAEPGKLVLGVPRGPLGGEAGGLSPDAEPLLASLSRTLAAHPELRLVVREPAPVETAPAGPAPAEGAPIEAAPAGAAPAGVAPLAARVTEALVARGVARERFTAAPDDARPELELRLSAP